MLFHKKKRDYFDEKREANCSCCRLGSDFDGAVVCKAGLDLEPDAAAANSPMTRSNGSRSPRRRCGNTIRRISSFDGTGGTPKGSRPLFFVFLSVTFHTAPRYSE